ncbi:unnamed protein product [Caretta caretta]
MFDSEEEEKRENMGGFREILATDQECWANMTDSMEKGRGEERREAQDSQQDKEREMPQDTMDLLRQQTQMLQTLADLLVQNSWTLQHLQSLMNTMVNAPYTTPTDYIARSSPLRLPVRHSFT